MISFASFSFIALPKKRKGSVIEQIRKILLITRAGRLLIGIRWKTVAACLLYTSLLPKMDGLSRFITKRAWVFLAIFLVIVGPALYGYSNTKMYYDFSESLPQDLDYMIANTKLKDRFDISTCLLYTSIQRYL